MFFRPPVFSFILTHSDDLRNPLPRKTLRRRQLCFLFHAERSDRPSPRRSAAPPLKQVLRGARNPLFARAFLCRGHAPEAGKKRLRLLSPLLQKLSCSVPPSCGRPSLFACPRKIYSSSREKPLDPSPSPTGRRMRLPRSVPPSEQEEKTSFLFVPPSRRKKNGASSIRPTFRTEKGNKFFCLSPLPAGRGDTGGMGRGEQSISTKNAPSGGRFFLQYANRLSAAALAAFGIAYLAFAFTPSQGW